MLTGIRKAWNRGWEGYHLNKAHSLRMASRKHVHRASDLLTKRRRHRLKAQDHSKRVRALIKSKGLRAIAVG